jgi:hypothetical protein
MIGKQNTISDQITKVVDTLCYNVNAQ